METIEIIELFELLRQELEDSRRIKEQIESYISLYKSGASNIQLIHKANILFKLLLKRNDTKLSHALIDIRDILHDGEQANV